MNSKDGVCGTTSTCTSACTKQGAKLTARGRERQRLILRAAQDVFLEQGFEQACLAEIITRAGGSLSTLYRIFGNKLGLFEAVIRETTGELFERLEVDRWSDDSASALLNFGGKLVALISLPEVLSMYRVALAVSSPDREQVQRIFYQQGPARIRDLLQRYLESQCRKGLLELDDTEIAAGQFIDMIKAPWHQQALLGVPYDPALRQRALEQGVQLFLRGARARG